ncbi:hypothetical protein PEPS_27760 (plasmid) [Persicobacter psychrovividus]|uniref:Uncharacterized protein n=1 Tax=Persicobacter psychrovividus TaxID=387638 RepID=A0ABM7VHP9_9BACT|nr:hypothetical protein PEPS_27760 [Persicobacter psychrovividus]
MTINDQLPADVQGLIFAQKYRPKITVGSFDGLHLRLHPLKCLNYLTNFKFIADFPLKFYEI